MDIKEIKIIIVEDEALIASAIQMALESRGAVSVEIVNSGEKALALLDTFLPDIILMDIMLSGEIDGIQAAMQIQSRFDIPIIYMTAHTDEATLSQAKKTGPYGYIVKPINVNELIRTIEFALYKHEMDLKLKESNEELEKHREHLEELVHERTADLNRLNEVLRNKITEHKRAEKALVESEEKYRALVENLPDQIVRFDKEIRLLFVNSIMEQALTRRLQLKDEHYLGKTYRELGFPEQDYSLWEKYINRVIKSGEPFETEYQYDIKTGPRIFNWRMIPEFDEDEKVKTVLSISRDITEEKKSEEVLRASLAEKEVLMREIHHRVKNNLQTIYSFINFQYRQSIDEKHHSLLRDLENRVKSMVFIHEKLYQSGDLSGIDFGDYIEVLVNELFKSYGMSSRIKMKLNTEKINLGIDAAIPCALIINELITNSLKYAFPEKETGELVIGLKSINGKYELSVRDNGIGLPETFNTENTDSLGLKLVSRWVKQIQGKLEFDRTGGTGVTITFNKEMGKSDPVKNKFQGKKHGTENGPGSLPSL